MALRESVCFCSLLLLLLLTGGGFAQNRFPSGTAESPRQNQTEDRRPPTVRLKTYQLRRVQKPPPTAAEPAPPSPGPPGAAQAWQNPPDPQAVLEPTPAKVEPPRGSTHTSSVKAEPEPDAPPPAESVSVRCSEDKLTVAVKQDFLGNGQLIRPGDLTLGGCPAVDAVDRVLLFESDLHRCGSAVQMTEEAIIYEFSLKYAPTPFSNTTILKSNSAEAAVRCYYQRRIFVSSAAVRPMWTTFALQQQAEQQLDFSLRLMTEDWRSQRPSNVYFLRDMMHMEASVQRGHHGPLRVFVDSCVATVEPDSEPRYSFVRNHGCLTDAEPDGAQAYFLPRTEEDKLHFQLRSFKFRQDDRNQIHTSCHLKATVVTAPFDPRYKACSFLPEAKRWVASGGDNKVCICCQSSCSGAREATPTST